VLFYFFVARLARFVSLRHFSDILDMATVIPANETFVVYANQPSVVYATQPPVAQYAADQSTKKVKRDIPLWAESLLWVFALIAMCGMVAFAARWDKNAGKQLRYIAQYGSVDGVVDRFLTTLAVAGYMKTVKIVMTAGVSLFIATLIGCMIVFNTRRNARLVMLSSFTVSSLLHVFLLYILSGTTKYNAQIGGVVSYILVLVVELISFLVYLVRFDGFEKSIVGKAGSRFMKFFAFISMWMYAGCLLAGVGALNPRITFITAIVSLILSNGVWIVYTGIRIAKSAKQLAPEVMKAEMVYP
jgi:hypothetical protein